MWEIGKEIGYWVQLYVVEVIKMYLMVRFILRGKVKRKNKKTEMFHIVAIGTIVLSTVSSADRFRQTDIVTVLMILYIAIKFWNIIYPILAYLLIMIFDYLIGLSIIWIIGLDYKMAYNSYLFSVAIGLISWLLLILISFVRKKKLKSDNEIKDEYNVDFMILNILCFGTLMYLVPMMTTLFQEKRLNPRTQAIIGVFVIIIGILIWYWKYKNIKKEKGMIKEELYLRNQFLEQQKNYYETLLNKERETKKFRHDIRQQLRCIYELEEQNKKEELHEYLLEMLKTTENIKINIETGNEIVNVVVNDIFKNCDLKIEWKGLMPRKLDMKQNDVCVLFANLLKNAKEATMQTKKNTMWVDIKRYDGNINIHIKNPVPQKVEVKQQLETTKPDKEAHGFGTENIQKVVDTYEGKLEYQCDDEYFEVNLMFYDIIM